jgi:hypothetical protein
LKVYIDYFWIPPSYTDKYLKPYLFEVNLPNLVIHKLLDFKSIYNDVEFVGNEGGGGYVTSDLAVIYLPFCFSAFVQVYLCKETIFKHFTVSFDCNKNNILMAATDRISEENLFGLGKDKEKQMDEYIGVTRQMLTEKMERGPILSGVLGIFDSIPDVGKVLWIKLTSLRKHHPNFKKRRDWPCRLGVSEGGYVGIN